MNLSNCERELAILSELLSSRGQENVQTGCADKTFFLVVVVVGGAILGKRNREMEQREEDIPHLRAVGGTDDEDLALLALQPPVDEHDLRRKETREPPDRAASAHRRNGKGFML